MAFKPKYTVKVLKFLTPATLETEVNKVLTQYSAQGWNIKDIKIDKVNNQYVVIIVFYVLW